MLIIQISLLICTALSIAGVLSSHIIETVRVIFISNIILMGLVIFINIILVVKTKDRENVKVGQQKCQLVTKGGGKETSIRIVQLDKKLRSYLFSNYKL